MAIEDLNESLRILVKNAVEEAPVAGFAFAALVELLWPGSESNNVTWDEMRNYVNEQIQQAIDQQLKEHLHAVLTGLSGVLHNYTAALQEPSDPTFIRENYVPALDQLTAAAPEFAPETRPYLVLPEYTQIYNLLLAHLRDGILHGASWGIPQRVIDDYVQQFRFDADAAYNHLITESSAAEANLPRPTDPLHSNVPAYNALANLNLALYPATFDQAYYWKYMDPVLYPASWTPPADTRIMFSQAYGYMPNNGTPELPDVLPPASIELFSYPITHLTVWGQDRLNAIQVTYAAFEPDPPMGAAGGTTDPPLGGSFAVGDSPTDMGQITTVYGWSGDVQQGLGFVFTKNGATADTGQITNNKPNVPPPNRYSVSLPGEVLGDVVVNGEFPSPYNSAGSTMWGFRYADSLVGACTDCS